MKRDEKIGGWLQQYFKSVAARFHFEHVDHNHVVPYTQILFATPEFNERDARMCERYAQNRNISYVDNLVTSGDFQKFTYWGMDKTQELDFLTYQKFAFNPGTMLFLPTYEKFPESPEKVDEVRLLFGNFQKI